MTNKDVSPCPREPRRPASMAAMSIFFIVIIASKARFASPPPAASASVSARGVICQERPQLSLHQPHWLSVHLEDHVLFGLTRGLVHGFEPGHHFLEFRGTFALQQDGVARGETVAEGVLRGFFATHR